MLLGETAGFVVPGLAWFAGWKAGLPPLAAAAIVVPAGACEGAVLGFGQWRALRFARPGFPAAWIAATAAGAGVAWAAGMTPSTVYDLGTPEWVAVVLGVALAPFLMLAMPFGQWLVLRHEASRAWRWLPWSAGAWALALPVTLVAPALLPGDATDVQIAFAWAAAGLVMATVVAVVTGIGMRRILEDVPH